MSWNVSLLNTGDTTYIYMSNDLWYWWCIKVSILLCLHFRAGISIANKDVKLMHGFVQCIDFISENMK